MRIELRLGTQGDLILHHISFPHKCPPTDQEIIDSNMLHTVKIMITNPNFLYNVLTIFINKKYII